MAVPTRLRDLAVMMRSKNAGPFVLTIDVFFADRVTCRRVLDDGAFTPSAIAARFRVPESTVQIIHVPQANAVKVTLPRPLPAGDVGDRDVAGGQQFTLLLDLLVGSA